ncbi:hypothetical protein [Kitasatospora purpeofusca]|uniref:hypothetical protein n=1 Tax=Kitasatospora purpeofusca TaxID=67352 RepID=UPI0035DF3CBF
MTGITITLRALHDGERRMEHDLLAAADRHRAEHKVHHVATDVARWSHEHIERLVRAAPHYGLDLPGPNDQGPGLWAAAREKTAQAPGRYPEAGLALLHDLRDLHLAATENSLNWEMLAQAAQATGDSRLLDLATACHPQTLRQIRWTNTMIKTLAPQLLTST